MHSLVEIEQLIRMGREDVAKATLARLADPMALMLEAVPMARQANAWLATLPPPTEVEVPILYNTETGQSRIAEIDGPRGYKGVGPPDIPTTLDLLWVDGDHVIVVDLKTGQPRYAHQEQLDIQALAAARLFGKPRAEVGFLFARKTKVIPPDWRRIDDLEGEAFLASAVMRSLPTSRPTPGPYCWTCPISQTCPEMERRSA